MGVRGRAIWQSALCRFSFFKAIGRNFRVVIVNKGSFGAGLGAFMW